MVHYLAYREASGDAGSSRLRRPRQALVHGKLRSRRGRASRSRWPADGRRRSVRKRVDRVGDGGHASGLGGSPRDPRQEAMLEFGHEGSFEQVRS